MTGILDASRLSPIFGLAMFVQRFSPRPSSLYALATEAAELWEMSSGHFSHRLPQRIVYELEDLLRGATGDDIIDAPVVKL